MTDEPKKTATDYIQLFATVLSPVLLAWLGFASTQHNAALDRRYQQQQAEIDRVEKQHAVERDLARNQTTFTKDSLVNLSDPDDSKRRLNILTILAYVERGQVPPFFLSVLAIQVAHETNEQSAIAEDFRTALAELSVTANEGGVRNAAIRALGLLGTGSKANAQVIAQVATQLTSKTEKATGADTGTTHEQLALLAPALTAIAATTQDPTLKGQATAALEKAPVDPLQAESAVAQAAASLPDAGAKVTPRVYLHIANEEQRPRAFKLQGLLRNKGWISPGIQNVGKTKATIPDTPEVRYIFPEDKSTADQAMQFLNQVGINNARVESGSRSSSDRPGHIEIWFSSK